MSEQPFRVEIDKLRAHTRARAGALIRGAVPAVAPAVAVSVWQAGAPWFEAYAGWVAPETQSGAVGFHTLFDLASLSKLFTATALLRLANDFKIDLDDPVGKLMPEFAASGPRGVDGGIGPLAWEPLPTPAGREDWEVDPERVTWRRQNLLVVDRQLQQGCGRTKGGQDHGLEFQLTRINVFGQNTITGNDLFHRSHPRLGRNDCPCREARMPLLKARSRVDCGVNERILVDVHLLRLLEFDVVVILPPVPPSIIIVCQFLSRRLG